MVIDKDSQKLYVSRMMSMEMSVGSMGATTTFIQEINYTDPERMILDDSHPIGSPAPHGIAINSDGSEVYTTSYEGDWLFKIILQSNTIEDTTLEIGYSQDKSYPLKRLKPVQCVSVQDSLLLISCEAGNWSSTGENWESISGQIQLWNTNTMTRMNTLQFDVDSRPWHIINSPNTNRVYVVLKGQFEYEDNPDSDGVACISYDENSMNLKWIKRSDEFKMLHGIDISVDGEKLYVSGRIDGKLHVLNAQDGEVLQSIYLGPETATKPSGVTHYSGSN
jgi:DNA-binding beta-propeller fold protein YncE